ncbi:LysR family transcriptional regulator [Maribrevibacterium harenarium]|uniref:LysR family transcriptional regulator n=2 Tax=Maribrevibacterium harenarium TaxID=2589817 RepID=A0A501WZ64_9GAMM|nr:LysR family transcriptional regulator [Maribrevibacterium harenarium]
MLPTGIQHLDLKSLTGLLYLLEECNVGRAADRLFITQSAMSRLLNRLRDAFADPLFIRTSKGMVPTAKAIALEAPVRAMLEQMASLHTIRPFHPATSDRTFRLQTTHYQAQAYVPEIASRFYRQAPQASLETATVGEISLLQQSEANIDAVLCSEYIQVPPHFERMLLGREKFCCVMAKDHPLAQQEQITLDDYLSYSHVLVNMGGGARIFSNDALGERARERRFAFKTPHFLAALETVGRTQLLLSTSGLLSQRFAQQFGLAIRPLPFHFADTHYYLAWPKALTADAGGDWLRQLCAQVVRDLIPHPEPV